MCMGVCVGVFADQLAALTASLKVSHRGKTLHPRVDEALQLIEDSNCRAPALGSCVGCTSPNKWGSGPEQIGPSSLIPKGCAPPPPPPHSGWCQRPCHASLSQKNPRITPQIMTDDHERSRMITNEIGHPPPRTCENPCTILHCTLHSLPTQHRTHVTAASTGVLPMRPAAVPCVAGVGEDTGPTRPLRAPGGL